MSRWRATRKWKATGHHITINTPHNKAPISLAKIGESTLFWLCRSINLRTIGSKHLFGFHHDKTFTLPRGVSGLLEPFVCVFVLAKNRHPLGPVEKIWKIVTGYSKSLYRALVYSINKSKLFYLWTEEEVVYITTGTRVRGLNFGILSLCFVCASIYASDQRDDNFIVILNWKSFPLTRSHILLCGVWCCGAGMAGVWRRDPLACRGQILSGGRYDANKTRA